MRLRLVVKLRNETKRLDDRARERIPGIDRHHIGGLHPWQKRGKYNADRAAAKINWLLVAGIAVLLIVILSVIVGSCHETNVDENRLDPPGSLPGTESVE